MTAGAPGAREEPDGSLLSSPPSHLRSNGTPPADPVPLPSSIRRRPVPVPQPAPAPVPVPPSAQHEYTSLPSETPDEDAVHEEPKPPEPPAPPRTWAASLAGWRLELLSLALAYAAFIGIAATLGAFEGKLATAWRIPVSINAVVAILSTVFKAALVVPATEGISQLKWLWLFQGSRRLVDVDRYDQASRGAWGSVLLIGRHFVDRKRSFLASFGAAAFLLTAITDPFFQAALQIDVCYHNVTGGVASIPRLNHYTHTGGTRGGYIWKLDADMQTAIMQGLISPPQNTSVGITPLVTCPTGNCTFPDDGGVSFSTLDMCHSCEDLTSLVERRPIHDQTQPYVGTVYVLMGSGGKNGGNLTFNVEQGGLNLTTLDVKRGSSFPVGPWARSSILGFQGLGTYSNKTCKGERLCHPIPLAFRCALRPCVKTLKATMLNGRYAEMEVSRDYLHREAMDAFQLAQDKVFVNGSWVPCRSSDNETEEYSWEVDLPEPMETQMAATEWHQPGNGSVWYQPHCVYSIGMGTSAALRAHGEYVFSDVSVITAHYVASSTVWGERLYRDSNMTMETVDRFMEGLATTTGIQMRKLADKDTGLGQQLGQVVRRESCIVIHWGYLVYGAAVMVLETVFLVGVIVVSHRKRWKADWKSSFLGLLLPRDADNVPDNVIEDQARLRTAARAVSVSLTKRDGRWSLETTKSAQEQDTD